VAGRPGPEAAASTWSNRALACEVAAFEAAHSAGLRVPRAYEQVVMDGGPRPGDGAGGRYRSFVGFGPEAIAGVSLPPTDGRDPGPHQWRSGASVPAHGERGHARCVGALGTSGTCSASGLCSAHPRAAPRRGSPLPWGLPPRPAHTFEWSMRHVRLGRGPSAETFSSTTRAPGSCSAWVSRRRARSSL
jgi:hypothetical protein